MPFRAWLLIAALGCLTPLSGQTQEPDRVTPEGPPIQEQPNGGADGANGEPTVPPLSVVIVESPQDAKDRRDREQKSDQHEADDLAAQRKAANAADRSATTADRQIIPTWIQAGVAVIGTVLLLATVYLSIRATNAAVKSAEAAEKSVRDTREIGERQVRAYLDVTRMQVTHVRLNSSAKIRFYIKNSGATPAKRVRTYARYIWLKEPNGKMANKGRKKIISQRSVAAGESWPTSATIEPALSLQNLDEIVHGHIFLVTIIIVTYEDVFGKTRRTIARGYAAPECAITGKGHFIATAKHNRSS